MKEKIIQFFEHLLKHLENPVELTAELIYTRAIDFFDTSGRDVMFDYLSDIAKALGGNAEELLNDLGL